MAADNQRHFSGKVALVTGGCSGIGKSTAMQYAREGAHVVVSDIHEEQGLQVVREIEQQGRYTRQRHRSGLH